jgi:acetolactate synthase-1/2/3 large subunit
LTAASRELADAIAEGLAAAGTRVIYGVPGGGNNLDLVGACERVGLRFVLVHTETAGAIMAGVDGELGSAPGACLVTRGPGAASSVNGAAQALLDRQPMLLISDSVSVSDRSRVSHQRLDQEALMASVTKWSVTVGNDHASEVVEAAIRVACTPPQGPVNLVFDPPAPAPALFPETALGPRGDPAIAERMLAGSERPVFAVGVGARPARDDVRRLLERNAWPVLTTYKAKGIVSEHRDNAAGLLTGGSIEAPVLQAADLIIGIGLDPIELIPGTWAYPAPVLLFGEWPLADPYFPNAVEIVGSLADSLALVSRSLPGDGRPSAARARRLESEQPLRVETRGLAPHEVVETARELAPASAIATVDAGAHMLVAMPLWELDGSGAALISSGLATMGFALPAAVAAAIARPDDHVVCFVGDGGLGMTLAELETVSRLGLAIVVIVFNDSALSLIEIKQDAAGHGGKAAVRYRDTRFASVAEGFGIQSRQVHDAAGLREALQEAFREPRPFLIDALVDPAGYPVVMDTIRGGGSKGPPQS